MSLVLTPMVMVLAFAAILTAAWWPRAKAVPALPAIGLALAVAVGAFALATAFHAVNCSDEGFAAHVGVGVLAALAASVALLPGTLLVLISATQSLVSAAILSLVGIIWLVAGIFALVVFWDTVVLCSQL